MAIQQRVKRPESFAGPSAGLWHPEGWEEGAGGQPVPSPRSSDRYVTVDEQVENTIGLVVARWPTVDDLGLRFQGKTETAWFDAADLQSAIDEFRRRNEEMLRPLRIGDTFWVRGFSVTSPDTWKDLRDVTSQARAMTKVAVAVA